MANIRSISVKKASPIGDQEIPDVILSIEGELPDPKGLEHGEFYDREAEKVVEALRSLPGGTWDRVLVKMLEKQLSLLSVSLFPQRYPETEELVIGCGSSVRTARRVVRYKEGKGND